MSEAYSQFGLPLSTATVYVLEDFVVSACNRAAYDTVRGWRNWEQPVLVLHGPEASGKTHLAHIWAAETQARFLPPEALTDGKITQLLATNGLSGRFVLDGLERVADETALFHLLNGIREQGGMLLLVSRVAPSRLGIALADARSRVNAAPAVATDAPDDVLLHAVLAKQFADRQLRIGDDVTRYLLARMDRSFASAREWVERIDAASLAAQRRVSVALLREMMESEHKKEV
ncbi:MAG: DNA replication protein [Alphaproteobacteria bacterium]|nr:DNA replication protein [Alphaproteobacteria bacterium]